MNAGAIVNFIVAALVAGVIFAVINRMSAGTSHAVRCSILMLFAGMLGQLLAVPLKQWDYWTDTLLFGAIAAFVVASRRLPSGTPPEHASAMAFAIMALTLILALILGHL